MRKWWEQTPSDILPDHPSYDVKKHLAYVQKLWAAYPYNNDDASSDKVIALTQTAPPSIKGSVQDFVADVLENDQVFFLSKPTLEWRTSLERAQRRLTLNPDAAFRAITDFLEPLYRVVPTTKGPFTTPLHDLFPAEEIVGFCWRLYDLKEQGEYLFPELRHQLFKNIVRASGHTWEQYDGKGKLIGPADSKLPRHEKLQTYLADTSYLELFNTLVPFSIPDRLFTQHGAILAKTGHGKTQLIQTLIADQLTKPDPPAMFIIDNMGAMLKKIERLKRFSELKDRLVIIDPAETPALNLFQFKASNSLYFYLFKAIDQSLTPRQATMISYLMTLMQSMPDATLDTLRRVCEGKLKPPLDGLDAITRDFFDNQFYGKDALINQTKSQIAQRLYTIARMGTVNAMLSAPENKFDALKCMQERKIVLINTDSEHLDEASPVFGRFLIAQIMAAARRRPEHQRHLALLIIDEAKAYFDEKTEEILADARQFGLGLLFATQHIDQLPEGVRKAMYGNTSIKLVGEVGYGDAVALSREMNTTAEHLKGLVGLDIGRPAQWACHVSGLTKSALTLSVPYGTLENLPLMSTAELAALRKTNRDHFTATTNHSQHKEEPRGTPQPQAASRATSASPIEYDTDI